MTHNWLVNTDGNGATARVVLLDFRKAFDLIDHSVLVQKQTTYDIPSQVKGWIVDFLMDRKQRVNPIQTGEGWGGLFEPPLRQNRDNS